MNEYLKKPKLTGKVNLISGEKEDTPEMIAEVDSFFLSPFNFELNRKMQ